MTELANMLRVVDGELVCADGSDVKEYLRDNCERLNISSQTPVCIIARSDFQDICSAANFMKGWPA